MTGILARLRMAFGKNKGASQPAGTPASAKTGGKSFASPSSVVEGTLIDGSSAKLDLADKETIVGKEYNILVPSGGPICLLCSNPTYARSQGEGSVLLPEDVRDDEQVQKDAMRAFALADRAVCESCRGVFCWSCLTAPDRPFPILLPLAEGSSNWECPRCRGVIPDCNAHVSDASECLTSQEESKVLLALCEARDAATDPVIDAVRKKLSQTLKSPGAVYFGVRFAATMLWGVESGKIDLENIFLELKFLDASETLTTIKQKISIMEGLGKDSIMYDALGGEEALEEGRAELVSLQRKFDELAAAMKSKEKIEEGDS